MKKIEIKVDWNDGDYVSHRYDIEEEKLEYFRPLFEAISSKGKHHNWVQEEREEPGEQDGTLADMYPGIPEEMLEEFNGYFIPSSEESYGWVHTICSIQVVEVTVVEELV